MGGGRAYTWLGMGGHCSSGARQSQPHAPHTCLPPLPPAVCAQLLMPDMFNDHLPDAYLAALQQL